MISSTKPGSKVTLPVAFRRGATKELSVTRGPNSGADKPAQRIAIPALRRRQSKNARSAWASPTLSDAQSANYA